MKKYVVLAAAIAMVAFAGCKKEEKGLVTLKIGTENVASNSKEAYEADYSRILFEAGDGIYINGVEGYVTPLNGDPDPYTTDYYSFKAQIDVAPSAVSGQEFTAVYPGADQGIMFEDGLYTCEFISTPGLIPEVRVSGHSMGVGIYQPWPMVAHYTCGSCVLEDGRFVMKNAVAVLTPSILYGATWFNEMANRFSFPTASPDELPEIYVDGVDIMSSTIPLYGNAHLENLDTDAPIAVINDGEGFDGGVSTVNAYASGEGFGYSLSPQFVGELPIAPFTGRGELTMNMYFHFDWYGNTYYFVYHGERCIVPEYTLRRGVRTILQVNMRDNHLDDVPTNEYMGRFMLL